MSWLCVLCLDHSDTPCGLWKSSEVVVAKASHPCGTVTLPAAGADVEMRVSRDKCVQDSEHEALSLPRMFRDYSDLDALKDSLPRLHILCDGKDSAADVSRRDDSSEVRLRCDEVNAVLNHFTLVADVITKRLHMSEELFNEETRGHRPVI